MEHKVDLLDALDKYPAAVDLNPTGYGFRLNYALVSCGIGGSPNCKKFYRETRIMRMP